MEFIQCIAVFLAAFGLVSLGWLALGLLLLPGSCAARMVVCAEGDGGGLEQTVKGLLWLRRSGLWPLRTAAWTGTARRWPVPWRRKTAYCLPGMSRTGSEP